MEMCKSKKRKKPTIVVVEAIVWVGKPSMPLNYPCHICGTVGHKLMNCLNYHIVLFFGVFMFELQPW